MYFIAIRTLLERNVRHSSKKPVLLSLSTYPFHQEWLPPFLYLLPTVKAALWHLTKKLFSAWRPFGSSVSVALHSQQPASLPSVSTDEREFSTRTTRWPQIQVITNYAQYCFVNCKLQAFTDSTNCVRAIHFNKSAILGKQSSDLNLCASGTVPRVTQRLAPRNAHHFRSICIVA